jgi:purine-nucleoside phosphorylase
MTFMNPDQSSSDDQRVAASSDWIAARWNKKPRVAIVLGTGAGDVAKAISAEHVFHYHEIPEFPLSTAIGHSGTLVCGTLAGVPVVAMKGRFHLYEGYSVQRATHGIRVMHRLGARTLIVTNAAGGINPQFVSGDVMLISSHLDLMFRPAQPRQVWNFERVPSRRSDQAYDLELMAEAERCAREADFPLYRGVYAGMLGPQYETRAEYRALRKLGGDAVGMSTIPEVCVANELEMRVLGLSVIANVADPDALAPTSGEEVIEFADIAKPKLKRLVENVVQFASNPSLG